MGFEPLHAQVAEEPDPRIEEARTAALAFVALVDEGEYGASWDEAHEAVRAAVTRDQWIASVRQARSQVDPLSDREFEAATVLEDPPGAPAGTYVEIRFRVRTGSGGSAVEAVVPQLASEGEWRVSGYFVQPG
jgi:hypothetical protein